MGVLKKFKMLRCKYVATPLAVNEKNEKGRWLKEGQCFHV